METSDHPKHVRWLLLAVVAVLVLYLSTLQTIPNGSSHPYMIDVGETQVALNVWGTLHATGYPLYTLLGNLFTPLPQVFGINPAAAASLFSLLWTLIALSGFYLLLVRPTHQPMVVAASLVLLGCFRSIWIHSLIAEVYSFTLAILVGLWLIALAPDWSFTQKLYGLAFLGGVGIAHHRLVGFAGIGLVYALLPEIRLHLRRLPHLLPMASLLFAAGFLPYLYLPLRVNAQAEWVYSRSVNTWDGFWFHFWGREADYLVKMPSDLNGWLDNIQGTLRILAHEMTPIGLVIVAGCLLIAFWQSPHRRIFWTLTFSGLGILGFGIAYHQAVLPEATLMLTLPVLVAYVVLAAEVIYQQQTRRQWIITLGILVWASLLLPYQTAFFQPLLADETGLHSIEAANQVPRQGMESPVLMLSWGPRYFAASYSRLVTGENADLRMVDHTAPFTELAQTGSVFYTEPDTFFGYPPEWWSERLGQVYLTGAGANLVRLSPAPRLVEGLDQTQLRRQMNEAIWLAGWELTCQDQIITLAVGWYAATQPASDWSVKVHLTTAESLSPLFQADSRAPVFGWRPTSTWQTGELIQDFYQFPWVAGGEQVVLGLYQALPEGTFLNSEAEIIPLTACES